MRKAFLDTLLELLGSKKFLTFLGLCVGWLCLKLGWNVDQVTIDHYLMVGSALLLGQGITDHGKAAAEIRAANDNASREHAERLFGLQLELEKARALRAAQDPAPIAA